MPVAKQPTTATLTLRREGVEVMVSGSDIDDVEVTFLNLAATMGDVPGYKVARKPSEEQLKTIQRSEAIRGAQRRRSR